MLTFGLSVFSIGFVRKGSQLNLNWVCLSLAQGKELYWNCAFDFFKNWNFGEFSKKCWLSDLCHFQLGLYGRYLDSPWNGLNFRCFFLDCERPHISQVSNRWIPLIYYFNFLCIYIIIFYWGSGWLNQFDCSTCSNFTGTISLKTYFKGFGYQKKNVFCSKNINLMRKY